MVGQKTVPMSEYFKLFITLSVFIQIRHIRHQFEAKMQYYHTHFLHDIILGLGLEKSETIQNSETLGQFLGPLYVQIYIKYTILNGPRFSHILNIYNYWMGSYQVLCWIHAIIKWAHCSIIY